VNLTIARNVRIAVELLVIAAARYRRRDNGRVRLGGPVLRLAPTWATPSGLLLIVPGLMIPLGILAAALATVVVRAIGRALRTSSDEAAVGSAGIGRTSGS
jgi:hypothetical protein